MTQPELPVRIGPEAPDAAGIGDEEGEVVASRYSRLRERNLRQQDREYERQKRNAARHSYIDAEQSSKHLGGSVLLGTLINWIDGQAVRSSQRA